MSPTCPLPAACRLLRGFGSATALAAQYDPELQSAAGLRLAFDSVAGKARSTDRAFTTDYRLTVWDRFAHSSLWNRVAAVAIWVLSTIWLGIERWRELSGRGS